MHERAKRGNLRNVTGSAILLNSDGGIGTEELDHYLCESRFPRLACSPWNLVPDKDDFLRAWNEYFGD